MGLIEKLKSLKPTNRRSMHIMNDVRQLLVRRELDRLRQSARYENPKSLVPFGGKVYSQSDEDGIIREIFKRIGTTNRLFVEFGVG